MHGNIAYLILLIVLFVIATFGIFVWYRIVKNKKWGRSK